VNVIEAIRRANRPQPPENSARLRLACAGAGLTSVAAAASQGEMSWTTALLAMALIAGGMYFSYVTRHGPPGWVKVIVALSAISALVWFFAQVNSGPVSDITLVENPLTILFAWISAVHAFHVPARRDLVFSLGASAGLMAVAAAQAIDLTYGSYVLVWSGFSLWALLEMWSSVSGGARIRPGPLVAVGMAVAAAAAAVFLVLPAPNVAVRIDFQARAGAGGPIGGTPGAFAGDSGQPAQLSKPGRTTGATRVGGYLGFAGNLDTALRGKLGRTVIMRVRAERPSYWVGETYDSWDGQSWSDSKQASHLLDGGGPFFVPGQVGQVPGRSDLQTFYVVSATADLVFHAESARQVWFPANSVSYSEDSTIVSPVGIGKGTVYTVESEVPVLTPAELRGATGPVDLPRAQISRYTELPHAYPQAQALARSVTTGATTTYDKVQALIAWMGVNTRYSTDIPPLPKGSDTVDDFLFGSRTGFCEQISTSLAVMLRSLGIPARETVGYVPGPYNPLTDLYDVRAEDAHAWVQVYIPGAGWHSFDPTASVPDANPSPGATALGAVGRTLRRIPPVPVGAAAGVTVAGMVLVRRRRRRPPSWAHDLAMRMERAGRRAGASRRADETIVEYARRLDARGEGHRVWEPLAGAVAAAAYGGRPPPPQEQRRLLHLARTTRVGGRGRRRVRHSAGGTR